MSGGGRDGDTWRPEPTPVTHKSELGQQGGGARPSGPCDLVETTALNSPVRVVIATLRIGDILEVSLDLGPPQRLLAINSHGDVAGSITSTSMLQLMTCITKGNFQYVAEVLSIRGAICQVQIRSK